jgi:hypothetical protein
VTVSGRTGEREAQNSAPSHPKFVLATRENPGITRECQTTTTMLRRSTRNQGRTVDYASIDSVSFFPDGPPTNEVERTFHDLNLQAFPCTSYARVDDILVHALFSTKRRPYGPRALRLEAAGDGAGLTDKGAMAISDVITSEIRRDCPTKEECKVAAMQIWCQFHEFLLEVDLPIIEQ